MRDRYPIILVIVFILSRLFWYGQGVRFDGYADVDIIQLLPAEAMKENLWEAIWYSHMQPPLYSLMMHMTGWDGFLVHLLWVALGLTASLVAYSLCSGLGLGATGSFLVVGAWCLLPSTILFENIPTYDYPTACLLILAAWALTKKHLLTFAVTLMVVVMFRSLFHPVWMLVSMLIATRREV